MAKEIEEQQGSQAAADLTTQAQAMTNLLAHPERLVDVDQQSLVPVMAAARNATGDTVPFSGVFFAVRCGDGGNWHNTAWWDQMARREASRYPLAAYNLTQEVCPYWSLPTQKLPTPDPRRLGPLVTVQSEFDPATAYELTTDNLRHYPARLLAVNDAGTHGQYGVRGYGCVDDVVNGYLVDDVVPPAVSICAGLPLPYEKEVSPQPGPVDRLGRPHHPSRSDHLSDNVRKAAEHLIR